MKKIVLALVLAAFAVSAHAQLVISANVGGNMNTGNVHTNTHVTVVTDSTASFDTPMENTTSFTGGLKVGYKFGKFQAGLAGSFTSTTVENQELDNTIIPIIGNSVPTFKSSGSMSTKTTAFTVAPYLRYDAIVAGDVSLFVELTAFFSQANNPIINAEVKNEGPLGISIDTTITNQVRPLSIRSIGARVTPGLSWQLSKNCGVDLYFDFLSLAYTTTTTYRTNIKYTFSYTNTVLAYETDITSYTTKENQFGAAIHGTPLLTELGMNNWVRVGFNFTF